MTTLKNHSSLVKVAIVALVALAALAFVSTGAMATSGCKKVNGKFTLQPATQCTSSPINLCATGMYSGDIKGNNEFTGTSFTPAGDVPLVFVLTGDNLIHTEEGDLMSKDAIVLNGDPDGQGDFAELDTVIDGAGAWAGATGQITAVGNFNPASGGEGEYSGEICLP